MAEGWLSIGLRLALYIALAAAFGVALFGVYALGQREKISTVSQRYRVFVGTAATLGIGLSIWEMSTLVKTMAGVESYSELSFHFCEMFITGTRMGQAWCIRLLALLACVALACLGLKAKWRFSTLSVASGVALATLAWVGHSAMGEGLSGCLHLMSDVVHLWAAGAWVGALVAFLILPGIRRGVADGSADLLSRTSSGFARIGTLIVVLLSVSGLLNYILIVGLSFEPLFTTRYGQLVMLKLALFGGMLVLAATNRFRLSPHLKAALSEGNPRQAAVTLRQSLWLETSLAVLVLASVAWLGTLSPSAP